jgi:neurofibromin 1
LSGNIDTGRLLDEVLDDIGFGGLWRSSTFHTLQDQNKRCTLLTDKLIEVWADRATAV